MSYDADRPSAVNETGSLFRRTTVLFTRYPILWVAPLLADVLRSLVQWFSRPLTRAALIAVAPRSVLGGSVAGVPSPAKMAMIGGGIGFCVTALGLLLYLYALGVVAKALIPSASLASRKPELDFEIPEGLGTAWLRASLLAAVFLLYSITFVSNILLPWAGRTHLKPGAIQALLFACIVPVLLLVLYLSIGFLRRYVLGVQGQPLSHIGSRMPYFLLLVAAALASNLAAFGIAYLTRTKMAPAVTQTLSFLILQILISAATAFPYAYAMTGLSLSPDTATRPDQSS